MWKRQILFLTSLLIICLLGSVSGQEQSRADKKQCAPISALAYEDGVPTITLEALLKEPQCYEGKFIRTYGFFRLGDEISELYCLDCELSGMIWLDFEDFHPAPVHCRAKGSASDMFGKTIGIAALGVFHTGGGFGHLNASRHKFSVICVEEATVLSKDWSNPQSLPEKTLREMRAWYKKASKKY
jgi:hypothetical protein